MEPRTTALPQEGQERAVPVISLPQAEQVMAVAEVYHCLPPSSDSLERSLSKTGYSENWPPSLGSRRRIARWTGFGRIGHTETTD